MRAALIALVVLLQVFMSGHVNAQPTQSQEFEEYTVQTGDSLWKICVKYQVGLMELIQANPQFKNPDLIHPMDKVFVPNIIAKGVEGEVLTLVNIERKKHGLSALTMNWELQRIARYKSADMANRHYFAHQSPTYGSPFDMMKNFGVSYRYAGENIAMGQKSPADVMSAWMNSEGHRANILSPNFTQLGVGLYFDDNKNYWTQMFIKP